MDTIYQEDLDHLPAQTYFINALLPYFFRFEDDKVKLIKKLDYLDNQLLLEKISKFGSLMKDAEYRSYLEGYCAKAAAHPEDKTMQRDVPRTAKRLWMQELEFYCRTLQYQQGTLSAIYKEK